MRITPGLRVEIVLAGMEDGKVQALLSVAKGEGRSEQRRLVARKICDDTRTALRSAREFLDMHLDPAGAPPPPGPPPAPADDIRAGSDEDPF